MKPDSKKFVPLEGLRGISALVVVLCHIGIMLTHNGVPGTIKGWFNGCPGPIAFILSRIVLAFSCGGVAVWIFWVLSGYVLSLKFFQLIRTAPGKAFQILENAAIRRYPRLALPVLACVMISYALWLVGWSNISLLPEILYSNFNPTLHPSFPDALRSALWDSFFTVGNPSYDGVLWTMEKEFFGSFFLFAFLALLGHRKSRFIAYPVLTIICPLLGYVWLDAFLAGIAICDLTSVHESWWKSLEARSLAGVTRTMRESVWFAWLAWIPLLIAISLAPLLWRVTTKYGDVPSLIVGTIAVALTLFSLPTQRFFASAIPAYLGRISFSLYLVHIPLLCSFSRWLYWALLNNKIASHSMVAFLVCVATIAVSVAVSELLTRAVDEPSVQIARRISGFLIAKVNGLGAQDASPHLLPVAHGQSVSHSLESATLNS